MLSTWLDDAQTWAEPASLSCVQRAIPFDWISQLLDSTNKASIRQRKLPAELVVWLCAMMSLRSRLIHDVKFGPANTGEVSYAKLLSPQAESLTLFDRCYLSAERLINWQRRHNDAHWLVPLKGNRM